MPLEHPETGEPDPDWWYAGSVDRVEGRRLIDWKSCGDASRFELQKAVGFQPECYAIGLMHEGYDISEYEYRVIETPGIKYCRKDRDPIEYEERCYKWLKEKPGKVRRVFGFIDERSLANARWWLWSVKERIELIRKTGHAVTNESACYAFKAECPYAKLCTDAKHGYDLTSLLEKNYEEAVQHRELELPEGVDPDNVLTYSAAAMFSLCEQKWMWKNIVKIQKKEEETSQSLYLGSAMHKGMEYIDAGDIRAAFWEIEKWSKQQLTFGEFGVRARDESCARARAMLRVANERWGSQQKETDLDEA